MEFDKDTDDEVVSPLIDEIAIASHMSTDKVRQILNHNYRTIQDKIEDNNDNDVIKIPYFGKIELTKKRGRKKKEENEIN